MSVPKQKPHRSKQNHATPDDFITAAKRRIGIDRFSFDFAADATNTKADRWWGEETNSLARIAPEWLQATEGGWGWLNPPFTTIEPWAERCARLKDVGGKVAFLVPAAVGSNWFRDHVDGKAFVLLLNGRLHFMPDRPTWGYPKDCILALYSPEITPGYQVWPWKTRQPRTRAA